MLVLARRLTCSIAWLATCIVLVSACTFPSSPTEQRADRTSPPSGDLQPASLEEQINAYFESNPTAGYDKIRSVIVMLDGQPAAELYYSSPETASDLYGVTVTVVSTLIGIALHEGHLTSLDQPLRELLPSYANVMPTEVAVTTLRSLLTMTAGFPAEPEPNETVDLPTEDWLPLILSDESRAPSGTFTFSSAGAHVLSAIVAEATGRSTLEYAREKLFQPLGIDSEPAAEPLAIGPDWNIGAGDDFTWYRDPEGYHLGYGHLAMTPSDMAKIGQLFLDGGQWNGAQIVPADWVANATRTQVALADAIGYGYSWWTTTANGHEAFLARGFGGQLIEVVPDLRLVVVMSATVPLGPAVDLDPVRVIGEVIVPAVE